jgi:soluble lytic murein transglycosylase-like protein
MTKDGTRVAAIDPRTISQLLQLQLYKSFDLTGSAASTSSDVDDTDLSFADLLQTVLGQAQTTGGKKVIPAADLLRMTGGWQPVVQQANAGVPTAYEPIIQDAALKYGVDPTLVKAVIQQESSFQPDSVSRAGAKGLMQLMDDTARGLGVTDSFDPQQNIHGGTQFLSELLNRYNGNEAMALAAYNAGPGRVDRLGVTNDSELYRKLGSLPQETQQYVSRVLAYKQQMMQV